MIILEKPYVSELLIETIRQHQMPVVTNDVAIVMGLGDYPHLITPEEAQAHYAQHGKLYTTSENAIGWILEHLGTSNIPERIAQFKDKARFRQMVRHLYPDFFFLQLSLDELQKPDVLAHHNVPYPFIIKPVMGFFSMGVYKVTSAEAWRETLHSIQQEMQVVQGLYPKEVMDETQFILEQYIEGTEYAFDAYFDEDGTPIVLNTFAHEFASDSDMSDRVYYTSRQLLRDKLESYTAFLKQVNDVAQVRNFPVHVEVREMPDGQIIPIEINPLRFGGWCTTADITTYAYGFNPYQLFLAGETPNWDSILAQNIEDSFALIILDNTTGLPAQDIARFDYEALRQHFAHVLEMRQLDYHAYPVFGFVFTQTATDNNAELDTILRSNLREYVIIQTATP
jgi:hypothetical protein